MNQPSERAPYVRTLDVEFDRPAEVNIVATDGEHTIERSSESASTHSIPLVGLYASRHWTVSVEAEGFSDTVEFDTEPLPASFPTIDPLVADPELMDWTLVPLVSSEGAFLVALDGNGEVAWLYSDDIGGFSEVDEFDGGISVLARFDPTILEWSGATRQCWSATSPQCTPIDVQANHELQWRDDALVTLKHQAFETEFPVAYDTEDVATATVADDCVVVVDRESGAAVDTLCLGGLLDTNRLGYGSLDESGDGKDWLHANAVIERDDQWLVELRHQDAIVAIDKETRALSWVFATPDNWRPPWSDRLLEPIGEVRWPFHAHGMKFDGSALTLFDNRNFETSPGSGIDPTPDSQISSRVAQFSIDAEAGTVAQEWEFALDPPVFSDAVGDADVLPDGDVLAVFGAIRYIDSVPNTALGRGDASVRIVQFDPSTGRTALDLDIWDPEVAWRAYRAARVADPREP